MKVSDLTVREGEKWRLLVVCGARGLGPTEHFYDTTSALLPDDPRLDLGSRPRACVQQRWGEYRTTWAIKLQNCSHFIDLHFFPWSEMSPWAVLHHWHYLCWDFFHLI